MSNYFHFNGKRIHYTERGRGKAIVLVHGYLETSGIFMHLSEELSGNFRVLIPDLPGHGRSDGFDQVYTMEFMASAIAGLIKHASTERAFVIGHSLGGYVTLALAEQYPELLSGFSLLHSHPFADDAEKQSKRDVEIKLVREGKKSTFIPGNIAKLYATFNLKKFSKAVEFSTETGLSVPDETIIRVLEGMKIRKSRISVIENGTIPFLWILGAHDNLIDCKAVRDEVKLPENSRTIILDRSGHMGFIEEEETTVRLITEFVSDLK